MGVADALFKCSIFPGHHASKILEAQFLGFLPKEPRPSDHTLIMETLTFLVLWWIFVAIGDSALDLGADLFGDVALDPMLFSDEQDIDLSGQSADLDFGLFSDDNNQLDQMSDSLFLANDIECDTSSADSLQFFGKMRRSDTCQSPPPRGASPSGADPLKKNDPFGFNEFVNQDPLLAGFTESSEKCPTKIFETSLTPVCTKDSTALRYLSNTIAATLYDVDPGALAHVDFESPTCQPKTK